MSKYFEEETPTQIVYIKPDSKVFVMKGDDLLKYVGEKQFKLDLVYLEMAKTWSKNSHCQRSKVGALIVKDKSIISDGYNGTPSGFPNDCEDSENRTFPWVLHAEANAITKLARSNQSSDDSTLYITMSPCLECSKLIVQSGVKRIVFSELYRNLESMQFLLEAGISICYNPLVK
jgi:dCMP deaminase